MSAKRDPALRVWEGSRVASSGRSWITTEPLLLPRDGGRLPRTGAAEGAASAPWEPGLGGRGSPWDPLSEPLLLAREPLGEDPAGVSAP